VRSPATWLSAAVREPYLRLAVLSSAAAAAAYGLGSLSPHVSAVVAAITALVSVRPTFHASVQEGLRQVLGVVVGAVTGFVALQVVGFSALAFFLALVAAFAAARLLRLGEEGAVAVGVTVILVIGPAFNSAAVETRLLGVLVGSVVALAFSYVMRPGTPHGRALDDAVEQGRRVSHVLTTIGRSIADSGGRVAGPAAAAWLTEAEDILARSAEVRVDAEDAVAGARFSPMIRRGEAEAVLAQARTTEATAITLVSMCRDLWVASDHEAALPGPVATSISDVLLATASAVTEQGDAARRDPAGSYDDSTGPVRVATRSRAQAASQVRRLDDTQPIMLGGSLLRDSEKITELLSGR
jgi:uncharacterized membrane protein YccC